VLGMRASQTDGRLLNTGTPEESRSSFDDNNVNVNNNDNNKNDNNNNNNNNNLNLNLNLNNNNAVPADPPSNRAMEVIDRIQKKLIGQDFGDDILDAKSQVGRLIEEATSETNLAMLFHGWCSFVRTKRFLFFVFF
jgi:phosphatidylinositol kinase/protein kinase (PI-3  family)